MWKLIVKKCNISSIVALLLAFLLFILFFEGVPPYEASVVFMYINVFLNGLQGLFLLLVYCVVGNEVKNALKKNLTRTRAFSTFFENDSNTLRSEIIRNSSASL